VVEVVEDVTGEDPQVRAILDDETLEAAPEQVAAVLVKAVGRNGGGKRGAVGNEGSRNVNAEAARTFADVVTDAEPR